MAIAQGVLFGILSMVGWGLADFFVAKAMQEIDVLRALFWSQLIGSVLLAVVAVTFFRIPAVSVINAGLLLVTGLLMTAAYLAYYRGLQVGKVAVISPITASWAMLTTLISVVFLGEVLTPLQTGAVAVIIGGTVLTAFQWHNLKELNWQNYEVGIEYALVGLVGWGVGFAIVDVLVAELGWLAPIMLFKVLIVAYLFVYTVVTGSGLSFPAEERWTVTLVGVFGAAAYAAFGFGITLEYTAIVAPIAAAFPMVTVILARIVFKENVDWNQWLGIAAVISALVLLSL